MAATARGFPHRSSGEIYTVDPDGSGGAQVRRPDEDEKRDRYPGWSRPPAKCWSRLKPGRYVMSARGPLRGNVANRAFRVLRPVRG